MSKIFFRDLATKFFAARLADKDLREFLGQPEKDSEGLAGSEDEPLSEEEEKLQRRLLQKINREIDLQEEKDLEPLAQAVSDRQSVRPLRPWRQATRMAAAIALLLGIGFMLAWPFQAAEQSAPEIIVWTNSSPDAQCYTLSDGSTVWLNTGTYLSLPAEFADQRREVHLNGEAFFEVAKDAQRPFIIHTGEVMTRVVGTSFNIKAFAEKDLEVAVVTGRVVVQAGEPLEGKQNVDRRRVELRPQEKAVFSQRTKTLERKAIQIGERPGAWKEGQLLFAGVSLAEVIETLNRKHQIRIETENDLLKNCRINVDLTGLPAEGAVRIVSDLINAQYHREGDQFIIRGKGCPGN